MSESGSTKQLAADFILAASDPARLAAALAGGDEAATRASVIKQSRDAVTEGVLGLYQAQLLKTMSTKEQCSYSILFLLILRRLMLLWKK
jgi:hypothetical protein